MTEEAKFSGLAGGESFAPDRDEADLFAPENEAGDETFVSVGEAGGGSFAFANGDDGEDFVSESEDNGGTFISANRDDDEIFASESGDDDDSGFGMEGGDDSPAFVVGLKDGGLHDRPDGGSADRSRRGRCLGVRLRKAGQVFFFPDDQLPVRTGSKVIVEFEQGSAFGEVETIIFSDAPAPAETEGQSAPGKILGLATAQDIALHAENRILADEAMAFCATCIRQRTLDMKLVDVEVLHDRSKIIFYFTAPARIDFRELVKDLVRNYRTRIELRQIGVRHETQMVGGIGNCGMVCCCHQYLRKFAPVTIKMGKEQNLFLNPAKLSGMCGRLLCCLSFEQSNYEEFNRRCPKLGKRYVTESGTFRIMRVNMFSRSIAVCSDAGEEKELTLDEWEATTPRRAETPAPDPRGTPQPRRASGEDNRRSRPRGRDDRAGRTESGGSESGRPGGGRRETGGHEGAGGPGVGGPGAEQPRRSEPEANGDVFTAQADASEDEFLS